MPWRSFQIAFIQGDAAEMQRQAAWGKGTPDEGEILSDQASFAAFSGRLAEARKIFREAVDKENFKETAARYAAVEALAEADLWQLCSSTSAGGYGAGDCTWARLYGDCGGGARHLWRRKSGTRPGPGISHGISKGFSDQSSFPPFGGQHIALQNGNPALAIQLLAATTPYDSGFFGRRSLYLRGMAYLHLGDGKDAAAEFQKILAHRAGFIGAWIYPLARLGVARALALQGDTASARIAYQDFLAFWKDADPDIPILKQAKAEYAKLH